jgi:small GTP-binding protein
MAEGRLKIVVFGSFNAGKSSFIQALDPRSRHIEASSKEGPTTVAFDFGRLQVGNQAVFLFGTPGQERFEFVRQILSRGMDGAIIVVDATTGVDAMTRHLYGQLKALEVPLAFMANKCDCPGAVPEAICRDLPGEMVHSISARNGENVHTALDAFVATLSAR